MSGRQKKPDARALFKQAKSRKGENVPGGASGAAAPPARAGVTAGKYGGKSKEELLALLRAKQAIAAASKANASAKQQKQQQQRPRPSGESSGSPATSSVASANHRSTDRKPTVKVPVMITPRAGTGRSSVQTGQDQVQAESGGLTGLLGIGGGDSTDDDDDDESNVENNSNGNKVPSGKDPSLAPAAAIPEGLPAGFFDNADDVAADPETVHETRGDGPGARDEPGAAPAQPAARSFGAERAAELAAEAAAEAEADALREAEKLTALRAAGITVVPGVAAGGEGAAGGKAAAGAAAAVAGGAGPGAATEGDPSAGEVAPNGSALPEGFFDDPEIDAKSRGVDLKAKKKEEEKNEWEDFMSFAEEVKKTEKEEEQQEEVVEEDKEQYEELEQATMMGRLALLMNKSESIARKRKRANPTPGGGVGEGREGGATSTPGVEGVRRAASGKRPRGEGRSESARDGRGGERGGGSGSRAKEDLEASVAKTGTAMREVAVASAPADAAAAEIAAMLRQRKRKKKKATEEAFAGEYIPMDPLDWRARGR